MNLPPARGGDGARAEIPRRSAPENLKPAAQTYAQRGLSRLLERTLQLRRLTEFELVGRPQLREVLNAANLVGGSAFFVEHECGEYAAAPRVVLCYALTSFDYDTCSASERDALLEFLRRDLACAVAEMLEARYAG